MSRGKVVDSVQRRLPKQGKVQVLWRGKQMAILLADGSIARVNPSIAELRNGWQDPTKLPH